jgi:hypothetical protein
MSNDFAGSQPLPGDYEALFDFDGIVVFALFCQTCSAC